MKDIKEIYVPILAFVGLIIICVILASLSYGDISTRHGLGYVTDTANNGGIKLNTSTFTKILDLSEDRISATYCNKSKRDDNKVVLISYSTVADATNNTGIILFGEDCYTMPSHAIYTGEISAISTFGTPLLTYIEY